MTEKPKSIFAMMCEQYGDPIAFFLLFSCIGGVLTWLVSTVWLIWAFFTGNL